MKRIELTATAEDWARVVERAGPIPLEEYVLACAIDGEDTDGDAHPLVLAPAEQRRLALRVERLERAHELLFAHLPGTGLRLHEALGVICRAAHRKR